MDYFIQYCYGQAMCVYHCTCGYSSGNDEIYTDNKTHTDENRKFRLVTLKTTNHT